MPIIYSLYHPAWKQYYVELRGRLILGNIPSYLTYYLMLLKLIWKCAGLSNYPNYDANERALLIAETLRICGEGLGREALGHTEMLQNL